MKKRFNLLVTIILMLSLLSATVPVGAAEDNTNIDIEFTASLFKLTGTADRNAKYPEYMFNAGNVPDNKSITIGDETFILNGDMTVSDNNDVIKVTASESTSFSVSDSGVTVKKIALLSGGYESDVTVDMTFNFANGGSKTIEDILVPAMTKNTENSYDMGKCIVTKKSGVRVLFQEGADNVYLASVTVDPQSVSSIKSVTLQNASGDMFIAAVNISEYSESDLEASVELVINESLQQYEGKTFLDITEDNITDVETLVENLAIAKEKGLSVATDENIGFANNLKDGYYLYTEACGLKNNIEKISDEYIENGEFKLEVSEVSDIQKTIDDLTDYREFINEYNEKSEERTKLSEIAEYFSVNADVEADTFDVEKIDEYINALEIRKYTDEADKLYTEYKNKEMADIEESDLEKLSELLELYEKIEELGEKVAEEEKEHIEYLYNYFDAYKNSEVPYTVDISKYFTNDAIGYSGQTIDPDTWITCRDENNIRGDEVIKQLVDNKKYIDEQLVTEESGEAAFYDTGVDIPFLLEENTLNTKVLDIILLGNQTGSAKSVTIEPANKERAEFVYVLLFGTNGTFDTTVTYDDNSQSEESISLNFGRTANQLKNNPYSAGYWYIGSWVKNKLDSSGMILQKVSGEPHLNVLKIPVESHKKISKIKFDYSSSGSIYIYAITEMPMMNDKLSETVKAIYSEIVTDSGVDTSDMEKIRKLSAYYNESVERGLKIDGIDEAIVNSASKMVLDISSNISRFDKQTVKAEINFSVPVAKNTLKPVITIDGIEAENAEYELSADNKQFTAVIPVTKYGGKTIKVEFDKSLAIEAYPSIVLENNYIAEYHLQDYISYNYDSEKGELELKNNSSVNQNYKVYAGIVNGDESMLYSAVIKEGIINSGEKAIEEVDLNKMLNNYIGIDSTAKIYISVIDENLSSLCEVTDVKIVEDSPVNGADFKEPVLNLETDRLVVNGYSEPGIVNILVKDEDNKLLYAGNRKTDGYFKFDIQIDKEKIENSGYLTIELGGDGFSEKYVNKDVYFPVMTDRITAVNSIVNAGSASEVEALLEDLTKILSVNFKPYVELIKVDENKKSLAERIYKMKNQFRAINDSDSEEVIAEKIANAQLIIKQQSVLEAFSKNEKDLVAAESSLLYEDVMNYDSIDSNGVTLYNIYNTAVTKNGKDEINNSLMGKNYETVDELKKALAKAILLGALRNPTTQGVGYISQALTEENAAVAEMNISKYFNIKDKSMINKGIANLNISSLEDVEEYIKEYRISKTDSSGSVSGVSGGSGSSGGAAVVTNTNVIENNFNIVQTEKESIFNDVNEEHWAYNPIHNLYNMGVVSGKGENRFDPEAQVTRAEFVKMLCILEDESPVFGDGEFKDVSGEAWYAGYVLAAYNKGWINGLGEGNFGPDTPISRQDICSILYRVKDFENTDIKEFTDSFEISEYAKLAVEALSSAGIVNGFPNGEFRPKDNCTRAQAASLLYNFSK